TKQATPTFAGGAMSSFQFGGEGGFGANGGAYTYNGQAISEALYRALTQALNSGPSGSFSQVSSALSANTAGNTLPSWNTGPVRSNQQGGANGQGIVVNVNYPQFNSQQQADQVMKQVVTQLRTVTGLKI